MFFTGVCWLKGTSLECAELIYLKITVVSDKLYRLKEEDGQIMSSGDSCIKRARERIAFLSMLTVRVVVLEYSQLHKKGLDTS